MIGKISLHLVRGSHLLFSLKSKYLITNQSQEIKRRYEKARNCFTEEGQGLYKYIFLENFGLYYFPTRRDFPSFFFTV